MRQRWLLTTHSDLHVLMHLIHFWSTVQHKEVTLFLPPLVFWTCNISSVGPARTFLAPASDDVQSIKAFNKHWKHKLTIVGSMKRVLRQSGQLWGAVFGLVLTAAFNAVRVRLSGSRWVKSGLSVLNSWPRPPGRQAWTRTRTAHDWKNKLHFFLALSQNVFYPLSRHTKKELNVLLLLRFGGKKNKSSF